MIEETKEPVKTVKLKKSFKMASEEEDFGDPKTWPYVTEDGSTARDLPNGGKLFCAKDGTLTWQDAQGETYKMVRMLSYSVY